MPAVIYGSNFEPAKSLVCTNKAFVIYGPPKYVWLPMHAITQSNLYPKHKPPRLLLNPYDNWLLLLSQAQSALTFPSFTLYQNAFNAKSHIN